MSLLLSPPISLGSSPREPPQPRGIHIPHLGIISRHVATPHSGFCSRSCLEAPSGVVGAAEPVQDVFEPRSPQGQWLVCGVGDAGTAFHHLFVSLPAGKNLYTNSLGFLHTKTKEISPSLRRSCLQEPGFSMDLKLSLRNCFKPSALPLHTSSCAGLGRIHPGSSGISQHGKGSFASCLEHQGQSLSISQSPLLWSLSS